MKYSSVIGIAAPEKGWVPSPGFILRRAAIMEKLKGLPRGRVLEMGCGPGAMLYELAKLGFEGVGVELSEKSRRISGDLLQPYSSVAVKESLDEIDEDKFDYIFSFEVIEHIENDREALTSWLEYLKDDGLVLISVPAHKYKWNITDLMAGHYRRYDRQDLMDLMSCAGLEPITIETYGWPASWLLEKVRAWVKQRQIEKLGINPDEVEIGDIDLTKESGVERSTESRLFKYYGNKYVGRPIFYFLTRLQKLFYKTDLGISYLVVAKKVRNY